MGGECEEAEKAERRKESVKFGEKLSRIETTVESIKEQMPARFEEIKEQITERFKSVNNWQTGREHECDEIRESIIKVRVEQAKQVAVVGIVSVMGSVAVSIVTAYFVRK